jgi:membrane protein DedA with SNARE-associated domain
VTGDSARLADEQDHIISDAAGRVSNRAETRFDRAVLRASGWLAEHTKTRIVAATLALIIALTPGVLLLIFPDATDGLEGFSYTGVFLTNLASTATFYFPVPGLTAAAQTLIATEGDASAFPWLVGIAGGAGMALGELTAYYAGYLGAELVRGRELPGPGRLRRLVERAVRGINWLMRRWGMATLFVLSAIPNPAFEVAGLTAGSVRMSFRRFLVAVVSGKIVRGLVLAYYGTDAWDGVTSIMPFV